MSTHKVLLLSLLLVTGCAGTTAPAPNATRYKYVGDHFTFVEGIYVRDDRVTGSFDLSDSYAEDIAGGGRQDVSAHVVSYSFTDGHQTLTEENSVGVFELEFRIDGEPAVPKWAGDGVNDVQWNVYIQGPSGGIILTEFGNQGWQTFAGIGESRAQILSIINDQYPGGPGTWSLERVFIRD